MNTFLQPRLWPVQMGAPVLFEIETPLGVVVRTTRQHWDTISRVKHPILRGRQHLVRQALRAPVQVRQSRTDPAVHLYYGREPGTPNLICAVAKHLNGEGFLITAYRTDAMKAGDTIWTA